MIQTKGKSTLSVLQEKGILNRNIAFFSTLRPYFKMREDKSIDYIKRCTWSVVYDGLLTFFYFFIFFQLFFLQYNFLSINGSALGSNKGLRQHREHQLKTIRASLGSGDGVTPNRLRVSDWPCPLWNRFIPQSEKVGGEKF